MRGRASYRPLGTTVPAGDSVSRGVRPELADVGRLARRFVGRAVAAARTEDAPAHRMVREHFGSHAGALALLRGSWPPYEQVNIQIGLDAWLAAASREHELAGLTNFHHMQFGLTELASEGLPSRHMPLINVGNVATTACASGPGGATRPCVQCGLYLVHDGGEPLALLLREPELHGPLEEVTLEVAALDQARAEQVLTEIRRLANEHNVFRGHVVAFGSEVFGPGPGTLLSFLDRPHLDRSQVVLPPEVLAGIEQQVLGVARHAGRLLASGQHLKRGVLLHGAPGTGKTHTVRYLLGQAPSVTVLVLSGTALHRIREACSVARALQPAMIVVEDVDLIAEERGPHFGPHPLLFQLLNEMDGLGADIDVTFLLTTNRADLLEEALAARPGRVDHAALLPLPDAAARRRLLQLYQGNLELDLSDPETVITRTEGVTASFIKELLRRAALRAAEEAAEPDAAGSGGGRLRVTDAHMTAALDQLLDSRNELTRILLGGSRGQGGTGPGPRAGWAGPIPGPRGADVIIRDQGFPPPPPRAPEP
jgi:ATPase family associated with various cellular activities (AAA)